MDYEYEDNVESSTIDYFSDVIKRHPFDDDDIRRIFLLLTSGQEVIVPHDMFAYSYRKSDVEDARITRVCKSDNNHIFRFQFLNGDQYIVRLSESHSYEEEIAIINAVAGVGVEVPRNFFSHPEGIPVNGGSYYAMLQEYIPGKDFEYAVKHNLITNSDKEILLGAMGQRLKLIHSITTINGKKQERIGASFYDEALILLDHEREIILEEGIAVREEFEELFAKLDSLRDSANIFEDYSFGLTHMDFHPKNILINIGAGQPSISSVIDWGDATFTNTFFDFALWDYWCGEDFLIDSLMENYGMESFSSAQAKNNVELTTIAALINTLCRYARFSGFQATQLGVWQRLRYEVTQLTQ